REMRVAAARWLPMLAVRVECDQPLSDSNFADAAERRRGVPQRLLHGIARRGRRGETQLVIVAAAGLPWPAYRRTEPGQGGRGRQRGELDPGADAARDADVAEVGQQAVGDIDAGAG